jgi:aminoglycoside 2'-N-acetyltransferase I
MMDAFGGVHFIVEQEGRIVSHGSVIERELHTGDLRLMTGYVEAVATLPSRQGRGHASTVMRAIGEHIDRTFQLGALDTGIPGFYEPLGWFVWKGSSAEDVGRATPGNDGSVLVPLLQLPGRPAHFEFLSCRELTRSPAPLVTRRTVSPMSAGLRTTW